jgi:response regulator RpfG family c-di-GMP phosphodiesterase
MKLLKTPVIAEIIDTAVDGNIEWLTHGIRVKGYVRCLLQRMMMQDLYREFILDSDIELIVSATQLHDIGKVDIPLHILNHLGVLPKEYFEIIKGHSIGGEAILRQVCATSVDFRDAFGIATQMAGSHHERWDGLGYPRGLSGDDISLVGRVVSIADTYDALVSARSYKAGWSHEDACREIIASRGMRYDPGLIDIFLLEKDHFHSLSSS